MGMIYYRNILFALCFVGNLHSARAADDSSALQDQLDVCYTKKNSCIIDLHGAKKVLSKTLKINPEMVTIRDALFECRMNNGACLYISEEGYGHRSDATINKLEHITLFGSKSIDGIVMNYDNPRDYVTNAAFTLSSVSIQGFDHGLVLGSGVWGVDMFNVIIGGGNTGIFVPPGTKNAGERNTFVGGAIYNNAIVGLDEESNIELDFQGTSFDYNNQQMFLNGPTDFTGHLENSENKKPEIVLNALPGVAAGSLYMSAGSTITVNGWNPKAPKQPCYVETKVSWSNVKLPATVYGFGGTVGGICGPGKVVTWDGEAAKF
ncbi:hypothetical protein AA0242T_1623 [Acetobacter aceti NRIC 0242]|uniref:Outer membrane protein n=2 Tax=Acetobacter aceti TaxID=435 RepID=A0AB33I934_ACEAC|nr:hypothetical protein EDC15_1061 [Acetobacter aceti NBRC 14818]BCK74812.1 hypothetical protein EMQ_0418 [Acetobacter aceti NBRC 14818]GAN57227.1 hypothetical protein Abac_014_153 [Acetobacter aceti NBRC 14818]GBO80921.1 hypothetical protein AA0242T_1623 [Acetobacter aceti NRIC 0242]